MKILFLGNFDAEHSSENYYKKTFRSMGHEVLSMQEGRTAGVDLSNYIDACDCFFWVSTHGWQTPGIEDFLIECRKKGKTSFAYHLDLYMGIKRERQLFLSPFFTVDHFFTVDKLMADWLNENQPVSSKRQGHFLPAGVYEGECFLGTPNKEKYPHEIIFTGSKGYHEEYPYRPQLIDWLHETYGERFGHYGGGGMPTVRGPELNNLYASAKIVIGDTLCKNFNYPWYSSDRLFEVTGRGGFLIYPYITGLEEWFDMDEIASYDFGNFDQLKSQIDFYLVHEPERERMKIAGFNRAKSEHTYRHRLTELLIKLELTK